jgi:hypothetical protein
MHTQTAVLAKRKTAEMQLQAAAVKERREAKLLAVEQKAKRQKHMVKPSALTSTHERHLRKTATKGVVALFNAVRKYQSEKSAITEQAGMSKKLSAAAAVAAMRAASKAVGDVDQEREAFIKMLKESAAEEVAPGKQSRKAPAKEATPMPAWMVAAGVDEVSEL